MNINRAFSTSLAVAASLASLTQMEAQTVTPLPPEFALPLSAGGAAGFKVRVHQGNKASGDFANSLARAESQLAGTLIDPKTGLPYVNDIDRVAFTFNADGTYDEANTIGYEQGGSGPNGAIPGIPGVDVQNDNIALEALTWLKLSPGEYTMIVNSDDGFSVAAGRDARDKLNSVALGKFDGGRGAGDTAFKFSVSQAGLYSFRLVYFEGGGGANVSWLTSPTGDLAAQVLVNDVANGGIQAYRTSTAEAAPYVGQASPGKDATGVAPGLAVSLQINDGSVRKVNTSSVALSVDGAPVTAVVARAGSTTSVGYTGTGLLDSASVHTLKLVFADDGSPATLRTNEWSFTVATYSNLKLPAPLYFENFESTEEGGIPAGWTRQNFTSGATGEVDPLNPNSDFYLDWTVMSREAVLAASWDAARRLNVAESYVNGARVMSLVNGKFCYAESDNRGGNQVQYLFTKDFDLTGKTDIYVAYNSIYEQNQDSIGAVEYSVDSGATWNPILYMLEGPDIVRDAQGKVDAVATMTAVNADTANYTDPVTGEDKGDNYGAFIGAPITADLAPYIQERINDDPMESKRVEFYRLPKADNQAKVRLRFAQAGTGSWYFGIDDLGLYSITVVDPPTIGSSPSDVTVVTGQTAEFKATGVGVGLTYQWQFEESDLEGKTSATLTLANVTSANQGKYRLKITNAGGSKTSGEATLTVLPLLTDLSGIREGLATHLKFDGNHSDSSGNNVGGTAVGSVTFVQGKVGAQALHYSSNKDGSSFNYVTVDSTIGNLGSTDFSVSFWAKISQWEGDPAFISNKDWNSGGNQGFVVATAGDGRIQWNIADSARTRKDYDSPGGVFSDGNWHHVIVTFKRDGDGVTYVDGAAINRTSIAGLGGVGTPDGKSLNIGQDGTGGYTDGGGVGIADGNIDDVSVWRRVISPQEAEAIYRVGNEGKSFDEATAPIAFAKPTLSADGLVTSWVGGTGPFLIQGKLNLSDPWLDLKTTTERTATIPLASPIGFFRVVDGATKTVKLFRGSLNAAQENNNVNSTATGTGLIALDGTTATYVVSYDGLVGTITASHIHGPAAAGTNAGVLFGFTVVTGTKSGVIAGQGTVDAATITAIEGGNAYFNVHTTSFGGGEIRGQITPVP